MMASKVRLCRFTLLHLLIERSFDYSTFVVRFSLSQGASLNEVTRTAIGTIKGKERMVCITMLLSVL